MSFSKNYSAVAEKYMHLKLLLDAVIGDRVILNVDISGQCEFLNLISDSFYKCI